MGGFECSTHIARGGRRLDMIAAVHHDLRADEDYGLLRSIGILTARDGIRWHLIDRGGKLDFHSFLPMLRAALRQDVQVIWDLLHYGYPDDADFFAPAFIQRFARYCRAVARVIADHSDEVPFYAPVNEISFFAWGAARNIMPPFAEGRDAEIKRQLVRAAIAGIDAIRDVDSRARFLFPEPTLHVVAAADRPDLQATARSEIEAQFEAWDMIAGYRAPELGGNPRYLDILGSNFYYRNQWEQTRDRVFLRWRTCNRDPRWVPARELLVRIYRRYGRPFIISETGHFGEGRAEWLADIARQAFETVQTGAPLAGLCLYPILDRPDWDEPHRWHQCGMWDIDPAQGDSLRVLSQPYAAELRRSQSLLEDLAQITAAPAAIDG
jgi:hypothetical protein